MAIDTEDSDIKQEVQESAQESVGDLLKVERERQGFTEKQVADRLHITMHYVRAIETDCYEKLPGTVFARGYIKNYALLLGLDKDQLTALFDLKVGEQKRRIREDELEADRNNGRTKLFSWLAVAVLAFLCGFLVFWAYNAFLAPQDEVTLSPDAGDQESQIKTERVMARRGNDKMAPLQSPFDNRLLTALNGQEAPADEKVPSGNTARQLVGL
ncbi:MAG: helix-turn-helix domain-containing protein [Gammaproteobacteria bacterium]